MIKLNDLKRKQVVYIVYGSHYERCTVIKEVYLSKRGIESVMVKDSYGKQIITKDEEEFIFPFRSEAISSINEKKNERIEYLMSDSNMLKEVTSKNIDYKDLKIYIEILALILAEKNSKEKCN